MKERESIKQRTLKRRQDYRQKKRRVAEILKLTYTYLENSFASKSTACIPSEWVIPKYPMHYACSIYHGIPSQTSIHWALEWSEQFDGRDKNTSRRSMIEVWMALMGMGPVDNGSEIFTSHRLSSIGERCFQVARTTVSYLEMSSHPRGMWSYVL